MRPVPAPAQPQDGGLPVEGTIRIYFADNTYKTLQVQIDTPVSQVLESLCKRLSASGRHADPARHELYIIAPGNQTLRERRLNREDKPLQIQAKGGTAFKFLFREAPLPLQQPTSPAGIQAAAVTLPVTSEDAGPPTTPSGEQQASSPTAASPTTSVAMGRTSSGSFVVESSSARLKAGTLERQLVDGTWHPCMVILDEDRLWYSKAQTEDQEGGSSGSGMTFLPLCDCDRVVEGSEDKRLLKLQTKMGTMTLRAHNGHERNSWLLAVVKQAALIKERDILLQAERIISGMEFRRASQQVGRLETFGRLDGVLATKDTRELFLDFARRDHEASCANAGGEAGRGEEELGRVQRWPAGVSLEDLCASVERAAAAQQAAPGAAPASPPADEAPSQEHELWAFVEDSLFPRFKDHPQVQCQMCWIAAGIA